MIAITGEVDNPSSASDAGRYAGPAAIIGRHAARSRDALANALVRVGVTPNQLTIAGFLVSCLGAVFLVMGAGQAPPWEAGRLAIPAGWWPLAAAITLALASGMDVLDGALARAGGLSTPFGGILDSTLDRFSDLAIYAGCAIHFAMVGNVTLVALCMLGASSAVLISYVKARTDLVAPGCGVGIWQRPERFCFLIIAAFFGHIPLALWVLGLSPWLTVMRRMRTAHALAVGRAPWEPTGRLAALMIWRQPRMSAGWDILFFSHIILLLVLPWMHPLFYATGDPLRTLLERFVSTG